MRYVGKYQPTDPFNDVEAIRTNTGKTYRHFYLKVVAETGPMKYNQFFLFIEEVSNGIPST
jgi:hypothetical protein